MLATRDQENLVHGHQTAAASKPLNQTTRGLQQKTPGNKYPKTPLKIPLNDENAPTEFGGKSGKGKGLGNMMTGGQKGTTFDKNSFITPLAPRARAPLGMKTTNAKTKAFQTPTSPLPEKELDKTNQKQTTARRPKRVTHAETVKLQVHGDESPLADRDVEYAPPKPKDIPYESQDFPDNCLNYDVLKPKNLMRGRFAQYHNQVDKNGRTKVERELEEGYAKSAKNADQLVMEMLEEEWTVGDVPETFRHIRKKEADQLKVKPQENIKKPATTSNRLPTTLASRKAALALSVLPKAVAAPPKALQPKPKSTISFLSRQNQAPLGTSNPPTIRNNTATATSRSTIGYTKGRSASNVLQKRTGGLTRTVSNVSQSSDSTMTPAKFAHNEGKENEEWKKKLPFLEAFEVDDEELELGLKGTMPECFMEEDEEEFVFTLGGEE